MFRVGLIGYGYWGPRLARNFHALGVLAAVSDSNPEALGRAHELYPSVPCTLDLSSVLTTDAVAIATPASTHFALAKKMLENGKHIFVEKPFTVTSWEAEILIEIAERKNLRIMVDHTFLFTGAVKKIRQLVDEGQLGNLYYYDSTRVNLGLIQHDINVIYDLAPHDLSIMDYLIDSKAEAISATGAKHLNGYEDVAFITVYFGNGTIAHINVNWLSPVKIRMTLIGGEKRMIVWNDLEVDEKLRVYDRGATIANVHDLLVSYRSGDMYAPRLDSHEALESECAYFIQCIENGIKPLNDGESGLRIVRMLEAANESVTHRGKLVKL